MTEKNAKSAKRFTHGGPRKGARWEQEQARVALVRAGLEEGSVCAWAVAKQLGMTQRALYFRLRRHKIPYVIGPMTGPPGRGVLIPESSLPLLVDVLFRRPIRRLARVYEKILSAPL